MYSDLMLDDPVVASSVPVPESPNMMTHKLQRLFMGFHINEYKINSFSSSLIKQLYQLFFSSMIIPSTDPIYLNCVSIYYKYKKDYIKMKEYFLKSYEHGNTKLNLHKIYNLCNYSWIYDLSLLTHLDLSLNNISILSNDIGKLINLNSLDLSHNAITVLPDSIGNLVELKKINLTHNSVRTLPETAANLVQLMDFDISHNALAIFPNVIGKMINLTGLNLSHNSLSRIPCNIKNLTNMTRMSLSNNLLKGDFGLNHINSLTKLTFLNLGNNVLEIMPDISDLQNLSELNISNNKLYTLHNSIEKLENLKTLWVFPTFRSEIKNIKNSNPTYIFYKYYKHIEINSNKKMQYYISSFKQNPSVKKIKNIIEYYRSINNINTMIQYILLGCNNKLEVDINTFETLYEADLKKYMIDVKILTPAIEICIIQTLVNKKLVGWSYGMCKKFNIRNPKIEHIIQFIDNKMKFSKNEDCPICFDKTQLVPFECFGHYYCLDCMYKLYTSNKCPLCKIDPETVTKKRKYTE